MEGRPTGMAGTKRRSNSKKPYEGALGRNGRTMATAPPRQPLPSLPTLTPPPPPPPPLTKTQSYKWPLTEASPPIAVIQATLHTMKLPTTLTTTPQPRGSKMLPPQTPPPLQGIQRGVGYGGGSVHLSLRAWQGQRSKWMQFEPPGYEDLKKQSSTQNPSSKLSRQEALKVFLYHFSKNVLV